MGIPTDKRLDTIIDATKPEPYNMFTAPWFGYKEESYPQSTDHHAGLAQYIGAMRNDFGDTSNSAHMAAQEDLRAADNSVRASLEAHSKGDFHLAGQHLDAAALRIESADRKGNAGDPAMMGVDPVHAVVADYKRTYRG